MIPPDDVRRSLPRTAGTSRSVRDVGPGCWLYLAPLPGRPDAYPVWARVEWTSDLFHGMAAGAGHRVMALRLDPGEGGAIRVDAALTDEVIMLGVDDAAAYGLAL